MENHYIAEILEDTAKLMELHGENPFKIRSYQNAAFKIEKNPVKLEGKTKDELESIEGIGKSLSQKIHHLLSTNTFPELDHYINATPPGVIEMMKIKGIGPKKVGLLWKELQVESPGELLYACNENRLVSLKGFGLKTQDLIKKSIEFILSKKGQFHFAFAEQIALDFIHEVSLQESGIDIQITGDLRRKCETIEVIELLVSDLASSRLQNVISSEKYILLHQSNEEIKITGPSGILIHLQLRHVNSSAFQLWKTTGNDTHIKQCFQERDIAEDILASAPTETDLYRLFQLPFIEPEFREGRHEIERAKSGQLPADLITMKDLKGILHNHSTYSDGIHTLEEMASYCRELGYEYIGISDHSKSAQYAGGLSIDRVKEQQEAIRLLNIKLSPFRIFSGIESDILADGSLDYPDEILASFDFVIASVHSGLRMDKEKATTRLLKAIRNPYTSILGHPTGRLLLSREGYPLDFERILDTCAEENVVVELNAHPYRLDLDWRWIEYAVNKGVKISINPDAHSIEGFKDMHYGVCVARKGFLGVSATFNSLNATEIDTWFKKKRGCFDRIE